MELNSELDRALKRIAELEAQLLKPVVLPGSYLGGPGGLEVLPKVQTVKAIRVAGFAVEVE